MYHAPGVAHFAKITIIQPRRGTLELRVHWLYLMSCQLRHLTDNISSANTLDPRKCAIKFAIEVVGLHSLKKVTPRFSILQNWKLPAGVQSLSKVTHHSVVICPRTTLIKRLLPNIKKSGCTSEGSLFSWTVFFPLTLLDNN